MVSDVVFDVCSYIFYYAAPLGSFIGKPGSLKVVQIEIYGKIKIMDKMKT